ncbi:MAG TPA: MFS transporter [Rhodopila sp.]|uniref:MFS transporter n=1 Tax=Rhodopila sp. TaxID=2480087 RepID=UPI002C6EC3DE|nr:MFS transporter [Rhodopila sp.]HVY16241.1 MFS transporter [Rhodopila sp.]
MAIAQFAVARSPARKRVLAVACGAHALHDGYTDLIYVLLPVWQTEFALSYAMLGILRMLYTGAMASLQMPASVLARRTGGAFLLGVGTAVAAGAYLLIGLGGAGFVVLAVALLLGGAGSATQHPLASSLVSRAYDDQGARAALGTYNFAGDLGKMAIPAMVAWLLALMPWRGAVGIVGALGLLVAVAVLVLLPRDLGSARHVATQARPGTKDSAAGPIAFPLLLVIGIVDSGTRMGFLAFLPFVLKAKGAGFETIGLALTLIFAGGAAGKLACGLLGERLGVLLTVILTEGATAAGILALHWLPLYASLACLPAIGLALNGTSSVLYGTVPDLVSSARREKAFGLFYTGTIGSGAVAPVLYGFVGDAMGPINAIMVVAVVCLLTIPLAAALNPSLRRVA